MRSAKEKQNMGRPRKLEPRDRQLNVGLTATEYESLVERAQALGMRPVHYGRALLLDQNLKVPKNAENSNIARLNYGQLVRLGNNLNQMVRHLHQTGDPLPRDLEPLLIDIRQIIVRGADNDR
jgi:Mobilization protein NikA